MKKNKIAFLTSIIFITVITFIIPKKAAGQTVSLSISPPLFEAMIAPGKEVTQSFIFINNASEQIFSTNIYYLTSEDEFGNVTLGKNLKEYDPNNFSSWFTLLKPTIPFGGKFFLPRGASQEIILKINIPQETPEGDYYFTLVFETVSEGQIKSQGSFTKAKIGTNILISVTSSGQPEKTGQIVAFKAPKIIDSLQKFHYLVTIANTGKTFFKPQGEIIVKPTFGREIKLSLAPLNILSLSKRQIPCIKDEALIRCNPQQKVYLGFYKATLKFKPDETSNTYEATRLTFAFPFTLLLAFALILVILRLLIRKVKS